MDKQFTALAGWSLLEKINTLSTDDMRETKFAQPITFLVHVSSRAPLVPSVSIRW